MEMLRPNDRSSREEETGEQQLNRTQRYNSNAGRREEGTNAAYIPPDTGSYEDTDPSPLC